MRVRERERAREKENEIRRERALRGESLVSCISAIAKAEEGKQAGKGSGGEVE